jgi:hypothetical protein
MADGLHGVLHRACTRFAATCTCNSLESIPCQTNGWIASFLIQAWASSKERTIAHRQLERQPARLRRRGNQFTHGDLGMDEVGFAQEAEFLVG